MLGRLVHKADFERLLQTRSRTRSAHFAVHHVNSGPHVPQPPRRALKTANLSTGGEQVPAQVVDNTPDQLWIGCVVPKRHAKRAATRNLFKRQIREAFARHGRALPRGLWMVRLTQGFEPGQFVSARSQALAQAARAELDALLARAGAA